MYITYSKDTGELSTPIMTCNRIVHPSELYEGEKLTKYLKQYDFLNIEDDGNIIINPQNYYVDLDKRELKIK